MRRQRFYRHAALLEGVLPHQGGALALPVVRVEAFLHCRVRRPTGEKEERKKTERKRRQKEKKCDRSHESAQRLVARRPNRFSLVPLTNRFDSESRKQS